jgi:hypothetical protein
VKGIRRTRIGQKTTILFFDYLSKQAQGQGRLERTSDSHFLRAGAMLSLPEAFRQGGICNVLFCPIKVRYRPFMHPAVVATIVTERGSSNVQFCHCASCN